MRFVDEVEITVSSGKGGDGLVSFRRESYIPRGGPDGGDGGRGGSVFLTATRSRNTLVDYRWRRTWIAKDGQPGGSSKMYGAAADDLHLFVPIGTLVRDAETGELIADLDREDATFEIPGGKGGRGNVWFKSSTRQTPLIAEDGAPGVQMRLHLELRLLADVGLIGFPNAGKSTLISRISAAKPKIADYPFTTLVPNLGVVSMAEGDSFVVADIPGLVEGASEGRGLGIEFLRHVERCALYLHLVSPDQPEGDPVACLGILESELAAYKEELLDRPRFVVLSKTDILSAEERAEQIAALADAADAPVFAISAVTGEGLPELLRAVWERVAASKVVAPLEPDPEIP